MIPCYLESLGRYLIHQRYLATLNLCADSQNIKDNSGQIFNKYIVDNLLPQLPTYIANTSNICYYLKSLGQEVNTFMLLQYLKYLRRQSIGPVHTNIVNFHVVVNTPKIPHYLEFMCKESIHRTYPATSSICADSKYIDRNRNSLSISKINVVIKYIQYKSIHQINFVRLLRLAQA